MISAVRIFALAVLVALTTRILHLKVCHGSYIPRYAYRAANCESLRQASPLFPEDSLEPSVSLASIDNCEIRMFLKWEADLGLFWLELLDHGAKTSVDGFRCHKIQDAAPVFEDFVSQAACLNKVPSAARTSLPQCPYGFRR